MLLIEFRQGMPVAQYLEASDTIASKAVVSDPNLR